MRVRENLGFMRSVRSSFIRFIYGLEANKKGINIVFI